MLETIREFAREKLAESGEAREIELRHARAYAALAEDAAPRLLGKDQKAALDRLELENGNLRSAIDACALNVCAAQSECTCGPEEHAGDDGRVELSLRLASALWRFWHMRGHLAEGRQRTERVLSLPRAETHGRSYLHALAAAGGVTWWMGDMVATQATYEKRLEVARARGDPIEIANALYDLSFVYTVPGHKPEIGTAMLEEALARFRAAGDRSGVAKTLWGLSNAEFDRQDWPKAAAMLEEVVRTFRSLDDRFGLVWALHSLGVAKIRLGAVGEARAALAEGLELHQAAGDLSGMVLFFYDFAELAAAQRRDERALRLFGAGRALKDRTGTELADYLREENRPFSFEIRALEERTDKARFAAVAAEGASLSQEDALEFALSERDAP
jgi:non-specific serine/threonine protein kinase